MTDDGNINIIKYFLIGNKKTSKKIYELINTDDKQTYVDAQEIFYSYINKEKENNNNQKFKIKSNGNTFHISTTRENLVFISYTNENEISSEQNFELFHNVKEYLLNDITQSRLGDKQMFLIEKEVSIIKRIIKNYLAKILNMKNINIDFGQIKEEEYKNKNKLNFLEEEYIKPMEGAAPNEFESNIPDNKKIKRDITIKTNEKNSVDEMLNNKKGKSVLFEDKFNGNISEKYKKFNAINSSQNNAINYRTNYEINQNYNNYKVYQNVRCDCCSKGFILFILGLIIAVQIAMAPLIIHFCDFSL